jgi:hypothetical protein
MRSNPGISLLAVLALALPGLACADDLMNDKVQHGTDNQGTIYIGSVAVTGKGNILETLQDIKLALEQPFSNDPKLADVVVCRITDDIGTHAKQLLICGTNKILAQDREILQSAMTTALGDVDSPSGGDNPKGASTACASGSCYEDSLSILNQSLNNQRRKYIKQQVNGASLRALLATLPYPKQMQVVPASVTTPAPAVVTSHV